MELCRPLRRAAPPDPSAPRTPRRFSVEAGLGVGALNGALNAEEKARDLRRMKTLATGLLLAATVIFLLARWGEAAGAPGWVGFVRATAEAAMVGALADWFAVTALFRSPLGLPIPHTAIIPRKKDQIGDSLGDFVGENFLAEDVVRDKLGRIEVARPGRRVARRRRPTPSGSPPSSPPPLRGVVTVLRDDDVQEVIDQVLVRKLLERPAGPPLGTVLEGVLADGSHHRLVDLSATAPTTGWRRTTTPCCASCPSGRRAGRPGSSTTSSPTGCSSRCRTSRGRSRPTRSTRCARRSTRSSSSSPATCSATRRRSSASSGSSSRSSSTPTCSGFIGQAWNDGQDGSCSTPRRTRRARCGCGCATACSRWARGCSADAELRDKIDGWLVEAAGYVVRHYRREITTLITDTVARWDAEETSRKVELQVGRDLQFIRINGTVVGALAGLVIYTVSQLVFAGRSPRR